MFNNRVVNGPGWEVTPSRMELAAPEGLLHSLLTWCLILIRLYRSEGAAHGREGACALPLCVRWLIMLSWQGGGGASKWGESEGSVECIKAPCPAWEEPVRLSSDPSPSRCDMLHTDMWRITQVFTPANMWIVWLAVRGKPRHCFVFVSELLNEWMGTHWWGSCGSTSCLEPFKAAFEMQGVSLTRSKINYAYVNIEWNYTLGGVTAGLVVFWHCVSCVTDGHVLFICCCFWAEARRNSFPS